LRLQRLTLKNFKGISHFTVEAEGQSISVLGDNATGKTTISDSFRWLLFDKDSQDKKDFAIKTLDSKGNVIPGIEHEVEAIIEYDGRLIALRKVYMEKWTKKKGSAQAVFTGHTTDYFIDGVPAKKKDYESKIAELCNEGVFKLLTDPTYFNENLHWQDRRKILLEVCGDITDQEVIAANKKLKELPDILKGRSLDDYKKIIASERTRINKELEKIPVRIDEVTNTLPEEASIETVKSLKRQIEHSKGKINDLEQKKAGLSNTGAKAEKQKQIAEIDTQLITLKNQHRQQVENKVDNKRRQLREVQEEALSLTSDINRLENQIQSLLEEQADAEVQRQSLRNKWYEVNQRQLIEPDESDTCPTCGQSLPAEQVQAAREKRINDFNLEKATDLKKINAKGIALKEKSENIEEQITTDGKKLAELKANAEAKEADIQTLKEELATITATQTQIEETEEYKQLTSQKAALGKEIENLEQSNQEEMRKLQNDIDWQNEVLSSLQLKVAQIEVAETSKKRIEELKQQERDLAAEFERLEHELYLIDEFTKAKVNMLDSKINSKFKLARFKLFDTQVNGGIVECCETTYQGVPYSSGLNNGHRNAVGMDIISTLSEHYNFYPPIFVDNAESITVLPEMKAQVIRLVVSENDKKLRVEKKGEAHQTNSFKEVM
jgi:DNA repair exonuclease SbcCD ATPase subunit